MPKGHKDSHTHVGSVIALAACCCRPPRRHHSIASTSFATIPRHLRKGDGKWQVNYLSPIRLLFGNRHLRNRNKFTCSLGPDFRDSVYVRFFCRLRLSGWIKSRDEIQSSQPELLMRLTQEEMFAMFAFPSLGSGMSVVRPQFYLSLSSWHIVQCFQI